MCKRDSRKRDPRICKKRPRYSVQVCSEEYAGLKKNLEYVGLFIQKRPTNVTKRLS